jgi:predicted nucleic acid-binding protein
LEIFMLEAELDLTEQERAALQEISRRTGKSEGELVREAVDQLITRFQCSSRLALMQKARGIWKDREDIPALDELRSEWNRFWLQTSMPLLIDTDVIIDYLRDRPEAVSYLENLTETLLISVVTVAELYAGVRDGTERAALESLIQAFEIAVVDEEIAVKGGLYRRDYSKSHNTGLADALIAATAEFRNARLVTLNSKHFPMLSDLIVPYRKA